MENALLIGLSRQQALAHQLDVIANNLANMRTAGYKGETLIFEEYLSPDASIQDMEGSDSQLSYVVDVGMARDFSEGQFEQTGNPLDAAITGRGWFAVETPGGARYTRDGAFKIDAEGRLVTGAGHPVLGDGGQITFGPDETNIIIASDGTINSSAGEKGKLRIVAFEQEGLLEKVGDNLYSSPAPEQAATGFRLAQGMLERANVKPVIETARMIEVTRAYATTSSMLEQMQTLRRDAIERLGSVPA